MNEVAGPIRVLHVDDDPDLLEVVGLHLERFDDALAVDGATSADAALDELRDGETAYDCIVSDHDMPGMNGLEFLRTVREDHPDLPFILFTGKGDEQIASEAISAGVTEYLQKGVGNDQYEVLANRILQAVEGTRAKRAHEESERRISTLIANIQGMVYRCQNEPGWPMSYVSEGCADLTGYDPATIERGEVQWGRDIIHEDDREWLWEAVQAAVDEREPFEETYRIRTADGSQQWVWERGRGVFEGETLVALEGFITDITGRKHREQDLERYRTLVETVGDPMYVLDEAGRFEMVNRAMERFLGYDRSELLGETPAVMMSEAAVERGAAVIADLLDQPVDAWTTWEGDVVSAEGERYRSEIRTALIWNRGEFDGSVGVVRDITERRAREEELELYGTIIQAVGDPVYALDTDGRFTFVNEAFEATTGYAVSELEGAHMNKVVRKEDIIQGRKYIQDMLDGNGRHHHVFEVELTAKDGEHVPAELHIALLPSHDGEFRGTAGVIRDIQERKARETRLEEFSSVVSHDLRNPLNVISGHTEMAMAADDPDDHLATIDRAAGKMEALIDDLLTLARKGQTVGETEAVQLSAVVDRAWETVAPEGIALEREADVTLEADPQRLSALFENLFRNAAEHAGPDVTVRVGVEPTEAGGRRLYVADDGPGIPDSKREEVLERGYTTAQTGTGFGLAIVHRIADAHGWTVDITESRSGGARFEFTM